MKIQKNTIVIALSATLILKLGIENKLSYYIHPRYIVWAILGAIICLLVIISHSIFVKNGHTEIETKGSKILIRTLLLVLVIALFLPPKPLLSSTVSQRILSPDDLSANSQILNRKKLTITSTNLTLRDWLIILNQNNVQLEQYKGKELEIEGFIYPGKTAEDSQSFFIGQFAITCCAADATPVGLPVIYDWRKEYNQDEWVKVTGNLDFRELRGKKRSVIIPTRIERIPTPPEPYIY